jgi:hypothetical protein
VNSVDTWVAIGALGFTVVVNTALFAFFLGRLFERARAHDTRLEKLEDVEREGDGGRNAITTALARVEEGLKAVNDRLNRMEATPPSRPRARA